MRFNRAVSLVGRSDARLADVAFECGYFDQAHLNRDFCEFAGVSPGAFVRDANPDPWVTFVQDDGTPTVVGSEHTERRRP
ncbi:MAG: Helix-turn-helix, AraC domain protein [Gaiellaceae bacterium]|jgi:AraC-like DNA-binding protein|nr:Helix-turn-helix, AraC domain protein [Gaiellaceae bacterium]